MLSCLLLCPGDMNCGHSRDKSDSSSVRDAFVFACIASLVLLICSP